MVFFVDIDEARDEISRLYQQQGELQAANQRLRLAYEELAHLWLKEKSPSEAHQLIFIHILPELRERVYCEYHGFAEGKSHDQSGRTSERSS